MNNRAFASLFQRGVFESRLLLRLLKPRPVIHAFGSSDERTRRIGRIYVINLDRQTARWRRMRRELSAFRGHDGIQLLDLTTRYPAIDATSGVQISPDEVEPVYSLAEQLYVEPQPSLDGSRPFDREIRMSLPELAVAKSHLEIWRLVANSADPYALILEDDVYFRAGARKLIDRVWFELETLSESPEMLYFSYREAGPTREKVRVSDALLRPVRGFWQMSGYVLSCEGARKLLQAGPIRGPVDLWINYRFNDLSVYATSRSIIDQRPGVGSDNAYSILPVLSTAGVLTTEKLNLYGGVRGAAPVIAFTSTGPSEERLAMALSMLGYRCCTGAGRLSDDDRWALLRGRRKRTFDAYVNPLLSKDDIGLVIARNPTARIVLNSDAPHFGLSLPEVSSWTQAPYGKPRMMLRQKDDHRWTAICRLLGCPTPNALYPGSATLPQMFTPTRGVAPTTLGVVARDLRRDPSPWIVPQGRRRSRSGIMAEINRSEEAPISVCETFAELDVGRWRALSDTFPGNRALFSPDNVAIVPEGVALSLRRENVGVRDYTAGSISTWAKYRYGRFETELRPAKGSGLVTGLFLHRYSPRQEIDIELRGKDKSRMLINVYFNPGDDGAELNYGDRGAPTEINLGFDAADDFHRYVIEWHSTGVRWIVDDRLMHERGRWDPTPIPHLPMGFFMNLWAAYSEEFGGSLDPKALPARTLVKSVRIDAVE